MMNGVEILAINEVAQYMEFNGQLFVNIFATCIFMFGIGGIVTSIVEKDPSFLVIILLGVLLGLFIGGCAGSISGVKTITGYVTEYKVTVSDEVSMNEFLERYEIINQEGKIYTVVEREDN